MSAKSLVTATNLGFPRMGANRDLKKSIESYWSGKTDLQTLLLSAKNLRSHHWYLQQTAGISNGHIPSNDFSFYDHVLDHSFMFGVIPEQYKSIQNKVDQYFAMGRGRQQDGVDVPALEMKKWFDTNYHYNVSTLSPSTEFKLTPLIGDKVKPVQEFLEAKAFGIRTRPVILGPITYLLLQKSAKSAPSDFDLLSLLPKLLPLYEQILAELKSAGAEWIQFDEPALVMDLPASVTTALKTAYERLHESQPYLSLLVATYFGTVQEKTINTVLELPISAIHLDIKAPEQLDVVLSKIPSGLVLSVGVVNGRNVWKANYEKQFALVNKAVSALGKNRVFVAPSCSLLHTPHSLSSERKINSEIRNWMSFSTEKIDEVVTLTIAANHGIAKVQGAFDANLKANKFREASPLIHNQKVKQAVSNISPSMLKRSEAFEARNRAQQAKLQLPLFPTTTIGSFPQTKEVRVARQKFKNGEWSQEKYDEFIAAEIGRTIKIQEEIGLDVLVHGESERNDMVEYFGENLEGFIFSENGWVQSYGSRCVKPPIIFGDVSRPHPMTVKWSAYAKSLTQRAMKGMLTGPVTILQWSFVRDDQPRKDTTFQIALALREEVVDLEAAGMSVIQIDEPAIREGLPLRNSEQEAYLKWAVDAFLISSTGVRSDTQIHSHFCYSDFNSIFTAIKKMDADCVTIENSKSDLKLLTALETFGYSSGIGPGLYDIHSPRVPSFDEMKERLEAILTYVKKDLLWINPDCGLKTRGWTETIASLRNMVEVAKAMRK
ncbi:methionine-synthesizing 5- methyltetrahydropteroyltriglutamate--homocysteine methyltransferase [Clydaea vesicula]|uniref:5-methyltetrahydropteroyltriglutamate--homocysteine S-methyltransferase n=1 Tax=Clydaea vesicula TaxID=447962 RepID=A0AAD5XW44_9FUNG|nr:methionine-synthesizing 5- methyltetrahydropteroyltriglutamate--homocysteine methyltransferase [Clydaea vesicula]